MKNEKSRTPAAIAILALSTTLFFFGAIQSFAAKKAPAPSGYKLKFSPAKTPASTDGGTYYVAAAAFPYGTSTDKATFVVRITNTLDSPLEFGIDDVSVTDDKGKICEVVTKSEAISTVEDESAARKKDIESRGAIMLRRAKGIDSESGSGLEQYSKSRVSRSEASQMDFGGSGEDAEDKSKNEIQKAIDDSLAIVEEDRDADLKSIEMNYLRDALTAVPGQTVQGYFEYNLPRRPPKQVTIEVTVGGESVSYTYTVSKTRL
jgi:hypothetical protein